MGLGKFGLAVLLATCASGCVAAVPQLAFPGAEGAGRYAFGGRGGKVYVVTSLADSGPGTLREAVEATGPRTVIFAISGTIQLRSPLRIRNGRITIAGQTAPGDGITLRDHVLNVQADDVIIRYIRARLGSESKTQDDAIWISGGRRIILDHISASWSIDETLSASANYKEPGQGFYDVTVQWCIIADSLRHAGHVKGDHGYGSLIRGGHGALVSFHHNLWANHIARMPRPGNYDGPTIDPVGPSFDFVNNVFYNWGGDHSGYDADTATLSRYNFINNTYVAGPDSKGNTAFLESNSLARAFFAGNSMNGEIPSDPWSLVKGVEAPGYRLEGAVVVAPIRLQTAAASYESVLRDAGDSLVRDAVDRKVVDGVRTRTGRVIDTEKEDGGWPDLKSVAGPRDTDHDGMPDAWETAHHLDPHKNDGARIRDQDGWTNLEEYLNSLVARD